MGQKQSIAFSALVAVAVWAAWLTSLGSSSAFSHLIANWQISLTMVFGSMVAGGTATGGGAVAFPVFTKLLHIPPHDAKVFCLAIQSVGMSAAALTILVKGLRVEWRVIWWASLGGIPGIILGSAFLAPYLPPDAVKMVFTTVVGSLAATLLAINQNQKQYYSRILIWRHRERVLLLLVGLLGGIFSGLVGNGIDVLAFSVMVLWFRLNEKIGTPTSVILMAINAFVGFTLHRFVLGDFTEQVHSYWLAAIPVVVIGAPVGALLCSLLGSKTIRKILISLIGLELISTLILIPFRPTVVYSCLAVLTLSLSTYYCMLRMSPLNTALLPLPLSDEFVAASPIGLVELPPNDPSTKQRSSG